MTKILKLRVVSIALTGLVLGFATFMAVQPALAEAPALGNVAISNEPFCRTGRMNLTVYYSHDAKANYFVQGRLISPGTDEWVSVQVPTMGGVAHLSFDDPGGAPYPTYTTYTFELRLVGYAYETGEFIVYDHIVYEADCTTGDIQEPGPDEAVLVETVLPISPAQTTLYQAEDEDDPASALCGMFEVNWMTMKLVVPSLFPGCEGYSASEIEVACLNEHGGWTTKQVQNPQVVGDAYQTTITQFGLCGIFPAGTIQEPAGDQTAQAQQETVIPLTPDEASPYDSIEFEGESACGVFEVEAMGVHQVVPLLYPECADTPITDIQVACLNGEAMWTNADVSGGQVVDDVYQVTIDQVGLCGIFPTN